MAKRVFQLAKELGVTSKQILDKCRAEDLDLKNHMATLSAGLEATIREWFSEGATVNAVETAEAVDLEEARRQAAAERRRRGRTEQHEEAPEAPEEAALVEAVLEAPVEAEEAPAPAAETVAEPAEPVDVPVTPVPVEFTPAPAEAPVEAQAPQEPPTVAAEAPVEQPPADQAPEEPQELPGPKAVPNKPVAPEVKPAGPQLVPRPAQLQGPRVIRVERPENLPPPRRTGGPVGRGASDAAQPAPVRRFKGVPAAPVESEDAARSKSKRRSPRRKGGRTAVSGEGIREWRDRDLDERRERLAAATGGGLRRHRASVRRAGDGARGPDGPIEVDEPITVKSLSAAMGVKSADLIKRLMGQGIMATVNQTIAAEMAELLAMEMGIDLKVKRQKSARELIEDRIAGREAGHQETRPPVVTFLGHVDHGKTSLLDRIRSAAVVETESGGITQHIGSYRYEKEGRVVTFLDTPGHEAFTHMRARGANMTDVVVLVVAADDGVMPQTVEAINHAKAAEVPIIVAMNKIDLPNANETRVLGQLAERGLNPREWGGQTEVIRTSAATGQGIDDLVETLALEAELQELKADPVSPAVGTVIEAEMDHGRGVVARVLVQDGTLRVGDVLLAGGGYGRVRQLVDYRGRSVQEAGPSTPVEVSGLDEVPEAGDPFYVADDLSEAKEAAEDYRSRQREQQLAVKQRVTLDNLFQQISAGEITELPLIVKADVQGSVEVLVDTLNKLSTGEVRVKILHAAVGGISSGDVLLAEASNAIILGFHVVPDHGARNLAEQLGVDVRLYRIIYQLTDEVKQAMQGLLAPEVREQVLGHAEVRQVFKVTRVGTIAGCYVTDGTVQRNAKLRITRDGIVIEDERTLDSLKRFKDDAREVRSGMECGIKIAGYDDVKVGDILEAYTTVEVARQL